MTNDPKCPMHTAYDPAGDGAHAPGELVDLADTVTEMTLIKHHFKAGVPAQRGIED